jgi:kynurenine formamidase
MSLKDRTPTTIEEYVFYKENYSNWGRWGSDDQSGTLNHISTDTVTYAASLVKTGRSVSCSNPVATRHVVSDPQRNSRPADHEVSVSETGSGDYIGVYYHGYVNTHIDSLCHFFTGELSKGGRLFNDGDPSLIKASGSKTHSVDIWRDGITTRGVLYDIPKLRGTDFVSVSDPVEGWDLEDWAKQNGIVPHDGDAVLVRSGYDQFWNANPNLVMSSPPRNTPGNAPSIIEYLYDTNASILGWDLQESGYRPYDYPARIPIHEVVIPYMGMPLLDNANFDRLASLCEELGVYEFQLTIAPLVINGGTGSPVNPIAIF